jgi:hypothetical protein
MTTPVRTIRITRTEKIAHLKSKRAELEARREVETQDYIIHRLPHLLHVVEATSRLIAGLNDRLAPLEDIEERLAAAQQTRIDAALAIPAKPVAATPPPARKPSILDMMLDWHRREGRRSAPQQLSVY